MKPRRFSWLAAFALAAHSTTLFAQTIVWTNTSSGVWGTAVNWSPNVVPGSGQTAVIAVPGVTVSLNQAVTINGLTIGTNSGSTVTFSLAGNTLTLDGPVTVNPTGSFTIDSGMIDGSSNAVLHGTYNWTGGILDGTLTLASGGTLDINNAAATMPNCTFTNAGTINWVSGNINGGAGGTQIYNSGLWACQSSGTLSDSGEGGNVTFNNSGTLRIVEGTNTATFGTSTSLVDTGVIDAQSGTLSLQAGASLFGGTATNLNGSVQLANGTFTINGTVTGNTVELMGGTLTGQNLLQGALAWSGGSWNSATVTVSNGCTLSIEGGANPMLMPNCNVTNRGTIAWSSGHIEAGAGGTEIYNAGLWNCQFNGTLDNSGQGGPITFTNAGTLRQSAGSGTTIIGNGVTVVNTGTIDTQVGTLSLQGTAADLIGGTAINTNGLLQLASGNFNVNGTVTSANVQMTGGNLAGNNVLQGALTWLAGNWNNTVVTISNNCTLNMEGGGGPLVMDNTTISNLGTVDWSSGHIEGGSGGTEVDNAGLWNCQFNGTFDNSGQGGPISFTNIGTLRQSGGTNTTVFGSGLFLVNTGTIDTQIGALSLQGSGASLIGGTAENTNGLLQLATGSFNINGTVTGENVQQVGGGLVGQNLLQGGFMWLGGNWNGATVTISNNCTVEAQSGSALVFDNATITNLGTFAWAANLEGGSSGTFIDNVGLWDSQGDLTLNNSGQGGPIFFTNVGTLRKSIGTNATTLNSGCFLVNEGTIDARTGTIALGAGADLIGGTAINTNGLVQLTGGNFNIDGTTTASTVQMTGGTLVANNFIAGALTWIAGTWTGAAVTVVTNSTVYIQGGGGDNQMANSSVTNLGTVAWSSGHIEGGSSGTVIQNGGLWDSQGDLTLDNSSFSGPVTFNNSGTLRKSAGTNSTVLGSGAVLNNTGIVDTQIGAIVLNDGGSFSAGWATNVNGLLQLAGGNFNINGTVTATNVELDGGALAGSNVLQGGFNWISGSWNGATVTVLNNCALAIQGGAGANQFANATVTNLGTVAWSSGHLEGGSSGTSVANAGLWNSQGDLTLDNSGFSGPINFANTGTFRKSAGTNSTTFGSGTFFDNAGTLDAQTGNISLASYQLATNSTLNFGISSLHNYGTITLAGAAALTGTVSANLNGGYQPIGGNAFTNLFYGSFTGAFSNAVLPFADAWSTNYTATDFYLQVLNARPTLNPVPTQTVNEQTQLVVTNTATDPDQPPQTLVFSLVSGPSGMTINSTNGILTWTPSTTNSPSTNNVTVAVTDNGVPPLSATNSFLVIVEEVNIAPTLPAVSATSVDVLATLVVTNTATESNPHATTIGYALVSPPAGVAISTNGIITWTPTQSEGPSTNTLTTVVTNNDPFDQVHPNLKATNNFKVIVFAPSMAAINNMTVNPGQTVSFTPSATDNDATRKLTYSIVNGPAGATINTNTGLFAWRPPVASANSTNGVQLEVTANQTPVDSVSRTFHIIVNPLMEVLLTPVSRTNDLFIISVSGSTGPDYFLQTTESFHPTNWQTIATNTPSATPFEFTATNGIATNGAFYRVKLGP